MANIVNNKIRPTLLAIGVSNDNDATDIGLYGQYINEGNTNKYAGIFRDFTDGNFKVFKELTDKPTNIINKTDPSFQLGDLEIARLISDDVGIKSTDNQYKVVIRNSNNGNYNLNLPAAQGGADTIIKNDGSGNLTWINKSELIGPIGPTGPVGPQGDIGPTGPVYIGPSVRQTIAVNPFSVKMNVYTRVVGFVFAGSSKGMPTEIYAVVKGYGNLKIQDITNSQTIATTSFNTGISYGLVSLGSLSNIPTTISNWEIQLLATTGTAVFDSIEISY